MTQALLTLVEWRLLQPLTQGYAIYMQANLPGSELKGQVNPYPLGSSEHNAFEEGIRRAVLEVQDGDDE